MTTTPTPPPLPPGSGKSAWPALAAALADGLRACRAEIAEIRHTLRTWRAGLRAELLRQHDVQRTTTADLAILEADFRILIDAVEATGEAVSAAFARRGATIDNREGEMLCDVVEPAMARLAQVAAFMRGDA